MGSKGSVLKRSGVETEERYLTWAVLTTPTRMGSAGYNPDVCTYGLKKRARFFKGQLRKRRQLRWIHERESNIWRHILRRPRWQSIHRGLN